MDALMSSATCAMCLRGVHYKEGRVACDGCDLPTDSCLCEPGEARRAVGRGLRELPPASSEEPAPPAAVTPRKRRSRRTAARRPRGQQS